MNITELITIYKISYYFVCFYSFILSFIFFFYFIVFFVICYISILYFFFLQMNLKLHNIFFSRVETKISDALIWKYLVHESAIWYSDISDMDIYLYPIIDINSSSFSRIKERYSKKDGSCVVTRNKRLKRNNNLFLWSIQEQEDFIGNIDKFLRSPRKWNKKKLTATIYNSISIEFEYQNSGS